MKFEKLKQQLEYIFNKFIKLPIMYKILSTISVSVILHLSFSLFLYLGLYNYTYKYNLPFNLINDFDINLLSIPFYIGTFESISSMVFITFATLLYKAVKNEKFIPVQTDFKLADLLYLWKKTHIWWYIEFKKGGNFFNLTKKQLILVVRLVVILLSSILFISIFFILYFEATFFVFSYIIIPVMVGIFLFESRKFSIKLLLIIIIGFTLLSVINIFRSDGIQRYLKKTNLGGEIPISIELENEKIENVNLIILTKSKMFILDKNSSLITQFNNKLIKKIYFSYDEFDPQKRIINNFQFIIKGFQGKIDNKTLEDE